MSVMPARQRRAVMQIASGRHWPRCEGFPSGARPPAIPAEVGLHADDASAL